MSQRTTKFLTLFSSFATVALTCSSFALAANLTWVGNTTANFNLSANWNPAQLPVANDVLLFGAAGSSGTILNNDLLANLQINGFTFNAPAAAYTLNGNAITLGGNITNSSTQLQTFGFDIASTAVRTVTMTTGGGDVTVNGVFSGAGGLTLAGTGGTLTLNNANTHTGATTTATNTTLLLNNANALQSSTLTITGTTANLVNFASGLGTVNVGGLAGAGNFALTDTAAGNVILSVGASNTNTTYSGVMSGGGQLTKVGTGVLTLSGANTYTGANNLNVGAVAITTLSNLGAGTVINFDGGTLQYNNGGIADISTRTVNINAGGGTINTNGAGVNVTFASAFGNATAGNLTKIGAGVLTLAGNNTYTGSTNLNGGVIVFSTLSNLGAGTAINFDGGTLRYRNGSTTDISTRTVTFNGSGGTIDTNGNNVTFASSLGNSGGGSLTKVGGGTLTLTGPATFLGALTVNSGALRFTNSVATSSVNANGGTLTIGTGATLGFAQLSMGGGTLSAETGASFGGGTTLVANSASRIASATSSLGGTGILALSGIFRNSGATIDFGLPTTGSITTTTMNSAGTILGGWATANSSSWAVSAGDGATPGNISALATYVSNTWASGNNTDVTSSNSPAADSTTNSLRFNTAAANTVTLSTGSIGNLISSGGILVTATVGNNASTIAGGTLLGPGSADLVVNQFNTSGTLTISSVIADGGFSGLTKSGGGTLILSGNNTYTGATNIEAGTLQFSALGNLGAGTEITFGGGTLQYATGNTADISVTTTNSARTVTMNTVGGAIIDTNGNNVRFANPIGSAGIGGLNKIGAGSLTLGGANTYTGATTITGGTLIFSALNNLGNGTAINFNGGTLRYGSGNVDISARLVTLGTGGGTIDTNGNNVTFANGIGNSGAGNFTKDGSGTLTLGGLNSYTGVTVLNGGGLTFGANSGIASTTLQLGGGALTLAANQAGLDFSGGTTVNVGGSSIAASTIGGTGVLGLGGITRNAGGTVSFTLPSTGSITTTTANTNGILGGWATVGSSDWAVNNGSNVIAALAPAGYTADTWLAGNNTDVTTSSSPASDSTTNSLRFNSGSNTVTLSGVNTISSGGILATSALVNNASTITGGTLRGAAGSDLVVHEYSIGTGLTINSIIADNSSPTALTKTGSGRLSLTGANTYTGATNLNGGLVAFTALNNLGAGTAINFDGGGLRFNTGNTADISVRTVTFDAGGATIDTADNNVVFANSIGNNGLGGFTKTGLGSLTLNAPAAYSGATIINQGALALDFTAGAATNNILSSVSSVTMGGGTLSIKGGAAGVTNSQTLSGISLVTGLSTLNVDSGTGTVNVTLGSITRTVTSGSMLRINGPASGAIFADTAAGAGVLYQGVASAAGSSVILGNGASSTKQSIATFGLTDYAVINTTTGQILPGDSVLGFWTTTSPTANNNNEAFDLQANAATSGGVRGPLVMRFNTPTATTYTIGANPQILPNVLVTPNMGANNALIVRTNAQQLQAGRNTGGNTEGYAVWQNNTLGYLTYNIDISQRNVATFAQAGAGTVFLTVASGNTYTGETFLNEGYTVISLNNSLGAAATGAAVNLNGGRLVANANIQLDNSGANLRPVTLLSAGGALAATTGSKLTVTGLVSGSGPLTIGTGTIAGSGPGTANPTPVVGDGAVALTGANTYTGGTTVSSGSLLVLNTTGSATGTGPVSVGSGGLMGGTGSVSGIVTVDSGGHLSPGTSNGTITVGGLSLATGSILDLELSTASNDLIVSNGGLNLATGSGVNLFQTGTTSPYGINGIYTLFNIASGSIPSPSTLNSNFSILNPAAGGNYNWGVSGTNITLTITGLANAASWIHNGGGSWGDAANWSATVPNSAGDSASFGDATLLGTANVLLNGDKAVGTLSFNNSLGASYSIDAGSGGSLHLNNNANTVVVTDAGGNHAITANVVLDSDANLAVSNAADTLTVSGAISGLKNINVSGGSGKVVLSGNNSYANTTIGAGASLQIGAAGASGTLGTGPVTDDGTLTINRTNAYSIDSAVTGTGALVQAGAGTTSLTNIGNSGTWSTSVSNGTLMLGTGSTIGTGALTMTSGTLDLNGNSVSVAALSGTGGTIDTTSVGGAATLTINQSGATFPSLTYAGTIANTAGTLSLVKSGTGTLILSGTGTYDGNTTITNGNITITSSNAVKAGSTIDVQVINGLFLGNVNVAANVLLTFPSGTGTQMFDVNAGSHATISGNITESDAANNSQTRFNAGNDPTTTDLTITGNATIGTGISMMERGSLILAGNSVFTVVPFPGVNTTNGFWFGRSAGSNISVLLKDNAQLITNNGLTLGGAAGQPTASAVFTIQDNALIRTTTGGFELNGGTTNACTVNFNGGTVQVTGFTKSAGGATALNLNGTQIRAGAANANFLPSTGLTVNVQTGGAKFDTNGFDIQFSVPLTHDVALVTPDGGLTKSGNGTLTLGGINTYNGPTTVNGGTLSMQAFAGTISGTSKLILGGGKFDTQGASQFLTSAPLQLTASSAIDMGAFGATALQFADSHLTPWTAGSTLSVVNWTGTAGMGGGTDQLLFGPGGLTTGAGSQVSQIHFQGYNGATLLGSGEVVPATLSTRVLGDWNVSGALDLDDLSAMMTALTDLNVWKSTKGLTTDDVLNIGDVNLSGFITNADIQAELDLLGSLGLGSVSSVPEPASWLLLGLGGVIFLARRRGRARRQIATEHC